MALSIKIKPLILVGSQGSGRSAISFHLIRKFPHKFQRVTTHTTRKPRQSEKNNQHFHFVDDKFFTQNSQNFVTFTKSAQGHFYGLLGQEVMRVVNQNKIPIFKMTLQAYKINIGRQGSLLLNSAELKTTQEKKTLSKTPKFLIRNKLIECNSIYVTVPSFQQLERRLGFSPLEKADRQQRIQRAKKQQRQFSKYFEEQDIIRSEEDMEGTIKLLQSRLFQLY